MSNFNFQLLPMDKVGISFQYSPELVSAVKRLTGRKWIPEVKLWEIPLKSVPEIPKILGCNIPPYIEQAYKDLFVPKPVSMTPGLLNSSITPYPFQKEGIEFLSSRKNALLADEVGLGKTLQAIGTALQLGCRKVLVACPSSVKKQWCREVSKFTDKKCVVIIGSPEKRKNIYREDAMFFIVNYELILKDLEFLNTLKWDMVIADEISRIKNWKSKTKAALTKIRTTYKLGLSATPLENNLQELYSIVSWIKPEIFGNFNDFLNKFCFYQHGAWGGIEITGVKEPEKLHLALGEIMIRRKKQDVYKDLPEIVRNEYYIPLTANQETMYREIEANVRNLVAKDTFDESILTQLMYLRECCNSPRLLNPDLLENGKVNEIVEVIEQFSSEHKIVVFSQWTKFLDLLAEELKVRGHNFVSIRGDVSEEQRDKNVQALTNDPYTRILLSSDAGGMGINLQAADVLIHCDLLWNPQKMTQREGRVHRIGQTKTVNVITIMTEDTVEAKVYNLLISKSELFDKVIEGSENITIDRSMIKKIFKEG